MSETLSDFTIFFKGLPGLLKKACARQDLNLRPTRYERAALTN